MKPIISVRNLGKQYRLGTRQPYYTLRESLVNAVAAPARRIRSWFARTNGHAEPDTLWALKDIAFDVQPGEVVGIIGRNGAGKSTLLKILSRITEPTTGEVALRGRVASLLEVGTGFHPELTGRENIYLNGAILGMKREEIQRKFDAIVDFGEIETFLETPVKHYSSGMYMRLAFAVAAHLDPEILVVDEVLAVGDAAFQKKCLGKMGEVARGGRTVLFVSHNMSAIRSLCSRGLLLWKGKIVEAGNVGTVVERYFNMTRADGRGTRTYEGDGSLLDWQLEVNGAPAGQQAYWNCAEPLTIRTRARFAEPCECPVTVISVYRFDGQMLFTLTSKPDAAALERRAGDWEVTFRLDPLALSSQSVYVDVGLCTGYGGRYFALWNQAAEILVDSCSDTRQSARDPILSPSASMTCIPA